MIPGPSDNPDYSDYKADETQVKPKKKINAARVFDRSPYFYECKTARIWYQNREGRWIHESHDEFTRFLHTAHGLSKSRKGGPSECDEAIVWIHQHQSVDVVTDLAGHFGPKVVEHGNVRILVKNSPKLFVPVEGDYPILTLLLSGMLAASEQYQHNLWWTAQALEDLYNQRTTMGLANVYCGPVSAGKSLWQFVLTQIFGGRMARPYQFMSGQTTFNAHTFAAEHLVIEDEHSATDLKSRLALGTAIKGLIANQDKQVHAKFQTPFMSPPLWQRLSVSLNNESANVALLPPGDSSLDHKVSLYDVQCVPMPMPTGTSAEQAIFRDTLLAELPHFIWDLLNQTRIPLEWRDNRFGLKAFRSKAILDIMEEHQPEIKLLECLDAVYFTENKYDFVKTEFHGAVKEGTVTEIEGELRHKDSPVKSSADDMLRGYGTLGNYLRKLLKSHPHRVSYKKSGSQRLFKISPAHGTVPVTD